MIPREILKKILQIELRTNRFMTESAEHGCPSRSMSAASGGFEILRAPSAIAAAVAGTAALRFSRAEGRRAGSEFRVYAVWGEFADRLKAELQTAFTACWPCSAICTPHSALV